MKRCFFVIGLIWVLWSNTVVANAKHLVLLLDWFANPNHAPIFVAEEQGFFKQAGLKVDIIAPTDPTDPPKLVAAGKADIGITYQPQFMQQVNEGLPLLRIGTLIDKPLTCLVTLKKGPIHTLADLKNQLVGYSGDTNSIMLKSMLEKNNLTLKDVKLINVHYDLTQALLSKNVTAVTGMMRNFEPIQIGLLGQSAKVFYPEQHGVPTYSELIFVAHKNKIHDPRLKAFIHAVTLGVRYLQQHPQAAWLAFVKKHPELNDELNKRAWVETLPYFALNPSEFNTKTWLEFGKFLAENGLVNRVQPINMYAIDLN